FALTLSLSQWERAPESDISFTVRFVVLSYLDIKETLRIRKKNLFLRCILKIYLVKAHECFFQIHVGKVGAEKRPILEPPADRSKKNFRQLHRQIPRRMHIDACYVSYRAEQFLQPFLP